MHWKPIYTMYGKSLDPHPLHDKRNASCAMSFWMPTEFLEARGPSRVRELALELAASLPFYSGYVGLSFNGELDVVGVGEEVIRLHVPGTTVQEMEGDKVCITLGEWPEAGDTERGDNLPAYRELARVMEPWLFHDPYGSMPSLRDEEKLRWERRFLD
jgi:hypothetical protein